MKSDESAQLGIEVFATERYIEESLRSQDGLGFGNTAEALADRWAPSLTNATSAAVYLSLLCAGLVLSKASDERTARPPVLTLERLWALGSALGGAGTDGMRGATYARRQADRVTQRAECRVVFPFFKAGTQAGQGVWGAYVRPAERLGLHVAGVCSGRGELVGEYIVDAVKARPDLAKAVEGRRKNVSVASLRELGKQVGWAVPPHRTAAREIAEGICSDLRRREAARCLAKSQAVDDIHLLSDLGAWRGGEAFGADASAGLLFVDVARRTQRILDAAWWASRNGWDLGALTNTASVMADTNGLARLAEQAARSLVAAQIDTDVKDFCTILAGSSSANELVGRILDHHLHVQRRKGQAPWVRRHQQALIESAPRSQPPYDPVAGTDRPAAPALRLAAFRSLVGDLSDAGAKW